MPSGTVATETSKLFASIRDHDLTTLAARCDDGFGIIAIDPEGGSQVIGDRAGWGPIGPGCRRIHRASEDGRRDRSLRIVRIVRKRDTPARNARSRPRRGGSVGADDGIRTRDLHLGKVAL